MASIAFSIRSTNANDTHAWSLLREKLWPNASAEAHQREIADIHTKPDRYSAFLAHSTFGDVFGFAEASIRHDYVNGCETSPVLFLEGIYVRPEVRGQGIAKALVEQVEQWGNSHACREFASDTDIANVNVQLMHKALGFEETERVVYFRKRVRE